MNANTQPPERLFLHAQGALHIQEVFPTIQGEGPFAGTPATFVRLAGCNLQCPGCDTDYTSKRQTMTATEVVQLVRKTIWPARRPHKAYEVQPLVVITGGEPFRQNLTPLVTILLGLGYRVQVETNGTYFLDGFPWDKVTVVCSPKTGRINWDMAQRVNAFKYVVQAGYVSMDDGLPFATLGQLDQSSVARPPVGSTAEIYVQPLDEQDQTKNRANLDAAVASCLRFGHRLCIQTHKLAQVP
jgi:7-carboxy-7-deazaguanine synthase